MIAYSTEAKQYSFACEWGCFEYGFDSKETAIDAYLAHVCRGQHIDSE